MSHRSASSRHWLLPLACILTAAAAPAAAVPLVAIADADTLVTFDSGSPGTIRNTINVTGLAPGENLMAIELRPLNDVLYVVTDMDRVYLIESCSGTAIPVGAGFGLTLAGTVFGMDFNPTVDRLRLVTEAEENFRFNPVTATVVDADPGTAGVQMDTALSPPGTVVAAAYDRNDNDPTTPTTLYVIDAASDRLLTQGGINGTPSANLGALMDVGPLGVDAASAAGFDIVGASQAFALLNVGGQSRLYSVNLASGSATALGTIGVNGLRGLTAFTLKGIFANGFESVP